MPSLLSLVTFALTASRARPTAPPQSAAAMPFRSTWAPLHGLCLLFALSACDGGGGGTADTARGDTVAFVRSNAAGGDDLYLVGITGSALRKVTDNAPWERVSGVLEDTVAGRIVFLVQGITAQNLWVVPKWATTAADAKKLTDFSNSFVWDYTDVKDRWIVICLNVGGSKSLWSIAADAPDQTGLKRLSSPTAIDVEWDDDWVTDDGTVVFMEYRPRPNQPDGPAADRIMMAAAPSGATPAREIRRTTEVTNTMPFGWGMMMSYNQATYKNFAVMREEAMNGDITFTSAVASTGSPVVLTPPIPAAELGVFGISNDHLCYLRRSNNVTNLFAVRLDGGEGATPRNISKRTLANEIGDWEFTSDGAVVFGEKAATNPASPARLFSTTITASGDPIRISNDSLHSGQDDDIWSLERVGADGVVIVRSMGMMPTGRIWGARLGVADSEVELGTAWTDAYVDFLDRDAVLPESSNEWDFPAYDRLIVGRRSAVAGGTKTNFLAVSQKTSNWEVLDLTNWTELDANPSDPSIADRRGSRLVFARKGQLRSIDPKRAQSEQVISDNSEPLPDYLVPECGLGEPYVLYRAGKKIYSADPHLVAPAGVKLLHTLPDVGSTWLSQVWDATDQHFVFSIEGQASTSIFSTPWAPATPSSVDISRPADSEDGLVGIF